MSENVIIAIIGAIGTLTGGIVGTIGSILIAKINRPPQEQKTLLPPSSGFSKIKCALLTAAVGLGAGLLISFWVFSGKLPHSQDNTAVTPATSVSDPVPAQKAVTSAKPLPKATSDSTPTQKAVPTQKVQIEPTQEVAPKEEKEKPKPAPKEEKERPKPAPKEEGGKKKK